MPESGTYGSVRGARSNGRPYRNRSREPVRALAIWHVNPSVGLAVAPAGSSPGRKDRPGRRRAKVTHHRQPRSFMPVAASKVREPSRASVEHEVAQSHPSRRLARRRRQSQAAGGPAAMGVPTAIAELRDGAAGGARSHSCDDFASVYDPWARHHLASTSRLAGCVNLTGEPQLELKIDRLRRRSERSARTAASH